MDLWCLFTGQTFIQLSCCFAAEAMFKPLEDTVALLVRFGDHLDPEVVKQLEDGPRQWRLLCKKMFRYWVAAGLAISVGVPMPRLQLLPLNCRYSANYVPQGPFTRGMYCNMLLPGPCSRREELAPFQTAEAIDVRRKSDAFGEKLDAYRAFFLQQAPFAVADNELSLEHVSNRMDEAGWWTALRGWRVWY